MTESYVELHVSTAMSFLRGASQPEQMALRAAELNFSSMAVGDRDGLYAAPRFYTAAKEAGVRPIMGAELTMEDRSILPVLIASRMGYQNLCQLLTRSKLRGRKDQSSIFWNELPEFSEGLVALTGDHEDGVLAHAFQEKKAQERAETLIATFGKNNVFMELQRHRCRGENRQNNLRIDLARACKLPLLATNGVQYATAAGRTVLDVFTCIREHTHLDAAGTLLARNSQRHLKSAAEMQALFADLPEAIANTERLADRLQFSLENIGYEFPVHPLPDGVAMADYLRQVTLEGARKRYGKLSKKVARQLRHELDLICKLGFEGYFLIVWDIVKWCRENDILVQGRGSAANSAVCYCLGVTAVDAVSYDLLFERFLSEGRKSWPDIDLDLPSGDRRERVIQEIYRRYGRNGAAMTANVITYRGKSAMREIGKALHFPNDSLDRFSQLFAGGDFPHDIDLRTQMERAGISKSHPRARKLFELYEQIYGLPRHLGQHSGGMVICNGRLDTIVPIENASMPGRSVIQWDKDDIDGLGMIKVDLLGLGMMAAIQDTIELCSQRGHPVELAQIPLDDVATFELMQKADTIGVFQIESRAQMATLPRMKPTRFYDVCVEVAIIRPGPIQGDMVHPYLARRQGKEPVTYYDERLRPVLERTLGIPLFQEQLLRMAMVMADFSGSEAEELRRALSFHRSQDRMARVCLRLRQRMQEKGIAPTVIEEIVKSVTSFAVYGFPESHAISFAILAYASAWLKVHRAPEFYASLLNNQPMGFYSSATLIKDAQRRGVKFRTVCVFRSAWRCILEDDHAIRLGFCMVRGVSAQHAEKLLTEREKTLFSSVADLKTRVPFDKDELRTLAALGAFRSLTDHRREALWQVAEPIQGELFAPLPQKSAPLAIMSSADRVNSDYEGLQLTVEPHPMSLWREHLSEVWRATDLPAAAQGLRVIIAGNVICRQRPGTAKGFVFISLEDETGIANAIVTPALFAETRLLITQENFLKITGRVQQHEGVIHVKAEKIEPLHEIQLETAEGKSFH